MKTKRNEESVKEEDGPQETADKLNRQTQQTERTPGKEAAEETSERERVEKKEELPIRKNKPHKTRSGQEKELYHRKKQVRERERVCAVDGRRKRCRKETPE